MWVNIIGASGSTTSIVGTDNAFCVGIGTDASHTANAITILKNGKVFFNQLSTSLTAPTTSGTIKLLVIDANGLVSNVDDLHQFTVDGTNQVGYKNIPQINGDADYTFTLADGGKHIKHTLADATARTYTIPAHSSVPFKIGTVLTFINMDSADVSIAINTDTLIMSDGSTGTRTLAQYGTATAIKVETTTWLINGTNLT